MRAVTALVVALALAGCDEGPGQESVESTTSMATTTTTTMRVTTTQAAPTTTETTEMAPAEEPGDGTESIGITDDVTIVVTDPEDG